MSKQPVTPTEMAERFVALFPPVLTADLLADYRLEHLAKKSPRLMHELVSLTLFWMTSALELHYRGIGEVLVLPEVHRLLRERWIGEYGFASAEWEPFLATVPERCEEYTRVQAEGGSVVSLSTQAAAYLESEWVVRTEDQPQVLALILDLVAVDAIGELFEEVELAGP